MKIFSIGRICKKTAGREAGKLGVIIGEAKDGSVLIDGEVRRRNCNTRHLEPLSIVVNIKENAETKEVLSAMQNAGLEVLGKKNLEKKTETIAVKPVKTRKSSVKKPETEKSEKKAKKEKKKKDDK